MKSNRNYKKYTGYLSVREVTLLPDDVLEEIISDIQRKREKDNAKEKKKK